MTAAADAAKQLLDAIPRDDTPNVQGHREITEWDNLRNGRVRLDRDQLATAAELSRLDLRLLVETLSDRHRPSVATIMAFLASSWTDDFGEMWLSAAGNLSMRALGVQTWSRQIGMTSTSATEVAKRLGRLHDATTSHAPSEMAALWWQLLAVAPRFERLRVGTEFILRLHHVVAHVCAKTQALPTEDELLIYERSNSSVAAVLPYAAQLGDAAYASRCLDLFRSAIDRILSRENGQAPNGSFCAQVLLESCGRAIFRGGDARWCEPIIERLLGKLQRWNDESSNDQLDGAVWLLSAACIAVVMEQRENGRIRADIIEFVAAVTFADLERLFWEANDNARLMFADLLSNVLALDPANSPRLIALAHEVRSPRLLCAVLKNAGVVIPASVLTDLIVLLRRRITFYEQLKADEDDSV